MIQRIFAKTGEAISLLGLGCMRFPMRDGKIDAGKSKEMIDYAYTHGVNYFDTAMMYLGSQSEAFIGEALSAYPRETYHLATKLNSTGLVQKNGDVEGIFADQLKKCRVEYFDFYLIHSITDGNWPVFQEHHVYERLLRLKEQGKIRNFGFSFHGSVALLETICSSYAWDFAQIQLNYLDWEKNHAREQYEILRAHGLQCVIMEPVRGGALANLGETANKVLTDVLPEQSIASWAIRYAASLDNVLTVLSGMNTMEQIRDNVRTISNFSPLNKQEYAALNEALRILTEQEWIACTKCAYCIDCPAHVDIPQIFAVYNEHTKNPRLEGYLKNYRAIDPERRADHCIQCGACMQKCPQHLEIPALLAKIAAFSKELHV